MLDLLPYKLLLMTTPEEGQLGSLGIIVAGITWNQESGHSVGECEVDTADNYCIHGVDAMPVHEHLRAAWAP